MDRQLLCVADDETSSSTSDKSESKPDDKRKLRQTTINQRQEDSKIKPSTSQTHDEGTTELNNASRKINCR